MKDLPPGWSWAKLSEIVDVLDNQRVPVSARERQQRIGPIPYYGAAGQVGWIDKSIFNEDLILLGEDGVQFLDPSKNKAYLVSGPAWVNNHAHVLRPRSEVINRNYLCNYLNLFNYNGYANGTTRLKLTKSAMKSIPVPIPPRFEQERIASSLEGYLSRISAAVAEFSAMEARIMLLRRSALQALRHEALQVAESVPLERVAVTRLGKMLDSKRDEGESTPYLRNINVRWGAFDMTSIETVPMSEGQRLKFSLQKGDLLVCEGGEPGRCAIWPGGREGMTYQKALHRVRPRSGVMSEWVALMIEETIRNGRAAQFLTGTTIKHLPQEKLRKLDIPVPSSDVQKSLISRFVETAQGVDRFSGALEVLKHRSHHLRRSLMAEAFAGRLAEQDPADERAAVLLELVRAAQGPVQRGEVEQEPQKEKLL